MNVAVVGSGVCGLAVTQALLRRGFKVTVLDVGETLDPVRQVAVDRLKATREALWSRQDMALLGNNPSFETAGLPKKMFFGSERIYADNRAFAETTPLAPGRAPFPTFTKGGFSNIWGAAALPADACDMADWPVTRAEMDPYFAKATRMMPIASGEGTLSRAFPAYDAPPGGPDPGPQGAVLLEDLRRAEARLLSHGTLYGKARLAVYTADAENGVLGCNNCGHCFMGCVRGSIYSTVPVIDAMARRGEIQYRSGQFVERVGEEGGKAVVDVLDVARQSRDRLAFDGVFLAGGPLNTTRLLLHSQGWFDRPVTLKESQKFALPFLRRRGAPSAMEHPSVTLASVFLETKVPELSDHWLHVQMVPMNQLMLDGVKLLRRGGSVVRALGRPLFRHLGVAWCGMHSDHSSQLRLTLRHHAPERLEVDLQVLPEARHAARVAARALARKGLAFGTLFCDWAIRISNPGSGTHCGASFPMRRGSPAAQDSDLFGRPFGWSRIFAVDASVLPSIPGTTLALTAMANAIRIGETAPLDA